MSSYNHNEAREPGLLRNPVIPNILALRRPRLHQHERDFGLRATKLRSPMNAPGGLEAQPRVGWPVSVCLEKEESWKALPAVT